MRDCPNVYLNQICLAASKQQQGYITLLKWGDRERVWLRAYVENNEEVANEADACSATRRGQMNTSRDPVGACNNHIQRITLQTAFDGA